VIWLPEAGRSTPFKVLTHVAFHSDFVMSRAGSQIAMQDANVGPPAP
jgi:hypothetical protein